MLSDLDQALQAYALMSELASASYHSEDFFKNQDGPSGRHLSLNTTGGRTLEFNSTMTKVKVFPGNQYPKTKPETTIALGAQPEVRVRALLARVFLSRLLARLANNPKLKPLRLRGSKVFIAGSGVTGEYNAATKTVVLNGKTTSVPTFADLTRAVAEAAGTPLPLPMDLTFGLRLRR